MSDDGSETSEAPESTPCPTIWHSRYSQTIAVNNQSSLTTKSNG